MTHLSIFSGIGGLDLAAEAAGFVTVGQCEWSDYPTKVLEKHWPAVPRWRDIRTLTGENFYERTGLRTVDVVSGGFPCQPFSCAGKQRGKDDDRYLWPEMLRVIHEIRPAWVLGENVPGIVNLALDTVLADLETIGYTAQTLIIPACAVDAPHRRDRCAILSHAGGAGCERQQQYGTSDEGREKESYGPTGKRGDVCHAKSAEQHGEIPCAEQAGQRRSSNAGGRAAQSRLGGVVDGLSHWLDEPDGIPRVATGVKNRTNRIKCLGNAVVPQQFYPIFAAIAAVEQEAGNGA